MSKTSLGRAYDKLLAELQAMSDDVERYSRGTADAQTKTLYAGMSHAYACAMSEVEYRLGLVVANEVPND